MNIEQLIKNVSNDTNVYFHTFEQDNDTIIAKSHFLNFHFGPERVDIVLDYTLPGPRLTQYSTERLPIYFDYNEENFYNKLIESIYDIQDKLIALEYRDEEEHE
jgi:hypothetical protein